MNRGPDNNNFQAVDTPRRFVSRALAIRLLDTTEARFDHLAGELATSPARRTAEQPRYALADVLDLAQRLGPDRRHPTPTVDEAGRIHA